MSKLFRGLLFSFLALTIHAAAQTPVTNNNDGNSAAPYSGAGYVPVYTGSSTLGNSVITQSGGNVGIGTTVPWQKLEVDGGSIYVANGSISLSAGSGSTYESQLSTAYNYPYIDTYLDSIAGTAYEGRLHFRTNSGGGAMADRLIIDGSTGNVGIGTTNPGANYKLDVAGQIHTSAGVVFPDGNIQTVAYTGTCGADYAEAVDVTGDRTKYEPGDILVIDPDAPGKFLKSNQAYSTLVAGIYSTKPGFVGRKQPATPETNATEVPMAMVGRVPTKVSAENGPIKVGDLLVASSKMGYAMKGTDRSQMLGAVIGKALGSLDSGTGVIEVLVTLQ